jgi:ADP-heptose:LPS heptosyltransferase
MYYDIELVEKLGAKVREMRIPFEPGAESVKRLGALLGEAGISDREMVIGVNPGGHPSHRWPAERFAEMMRMVGKDVECAFAVSGGPEERSLADEVIRKAGVKAVNMAGRLDLETLAALIKRSSVSVSNDTAAMNIAAVLDTPTVAIFGPGFLKRFDPRVLSRKAAVVYKGAPCAPCNKKVCATKECLAGITPDEVAEAVMKSLGNRSTR